ncbi:MAG: hypothetical protein Q9184_006712, partial [Pyrenodesmia sp. 2 TL-2023]
EAHDGVIDLSADDLDTVKRVLSYLYTADYYDEDPVATPSLPSRSHTPTTDDGAVSPTFPSVFINVPNRKIQTPEPLGATNPKEIAAPSTSPEQASLAALLNNVLVYALAEKYDIQPLKGFAHQKFQNRAAYKWASEDIITVLQEVYAATPANDTLLRGAIHQVCDCYANCLMVNRKFLAMVKKDGGLAYEMLNSVYGAKEKQGVDHANKEKEWRSALQSRDDQIKSLKEWAKVELQEVNDLLTKYVECSVCKDPFVPKIKRGRDTRQKTVEVACGHCGSVGWCRERDVESG